MAQSFRGGIFDRNAMPGAMAQVSRGLLKPTVWEAFVDQDIPKRGGAVGSWSSSEGDPLAEVLVVRDDDFQDTLAWLNSYFSGLSPVTQWCRVIRHSQAELIRRRRPTVSLGSVLGAWVGAIVAECSVQAGGIQNLRDVPGSAAASSATFAAGRATAVWNDAADLAEIARRHDDLSQSLRDGARPVRAEALTPIWSVLNGHHGRLLTGDRRALEPLASLVTRVTKSAEQSETAEVVATTSRQAREYFDLPEIEQCAEGPQVERVKALDRLGERLSSGPRSPAVDALLGLGASFIDPGSAVAPELLRRYTRQLPTAPIWQGLFAGAMMPLRILTDQGGLGRIVAKALLMPDDLYGRPSCDIAYDELVRWITPGRSLKQDVRGMSARSLAVELVPGVTCVFAYGRAETAAVPPKVDATRSSGENRAIGSIRSLQELALVVMSLLQRMDRLEAQSTTVQRSLDLPEPQDGKGRKGSRRN